jgi:hypothetical protein
VFDHTTGNASGAMLFFDGSANSSARVYFRSATLAAGVQYQFSYWQEADNMGSPPDLQVSVNNTPLGTLQDSAAQTWEPFSATFTPTTSGTYVFSINDLNTVAFLNDGGLDDIQLVSLLAGDANGDGKVDLTDLNAVLNHLGETDSSRVMGRVKAARRGRVQKQPF